MEQHIIEAVLTALGAIATGVIGYVARAIVKFVISKHLTLIATEAVHFAEDAFKGLGGDKKLDEACKWVAARFKKYHIKIDEAQIKGAVRSAYNKLKKDIQKDLKEAK